MTMSRLIDADKLPIKFDGHKFVVVRKNDLDNAPTVDAVEVVRCKDCIYQAECAFTEWLGRNGNGFCSCGEKINEVEE